MLKGPIVGIRGRPRGPRALAATTTWGSGRQRLSTWAAGTLEQHQPESDGARTTAEGRGTRTAPALSP